MPGRFVRTLICLLPCLLAGGLGASAASPYGIDGLTLGAQAHPDRAYECGPSEVFQGFTWCQRRRQERGNRGSFGAFTGVMQAPDGAAVYLNRIVEPAFFGANDLQDEIGRLTAKFGERARVMRLPLREGIPSAVIAQWGKIELEQLDDDTVAALAGKDAKLPPLLVDYLGNVRRSAELRLPVFRLSGGAGYLWSASTDGSGRGHLRLVAVDASALGTGPSTTSPSRPQPAAAPKPVEAKPAEAKLIETKPVEIKPVEPKPVEPKPIAPKLAEAKPPEAARIETKPTEAAPISPKPVKVRTEAPAAPPAAPAVAKPAHSGKDEARLATGSIENVRVVPARLEQVAPPPVPNPSASGRPGSKADAAVIVLMLLAVLAVGLAMWLRRKEAHESEVYASARAHLRARMGQGQAMAREAGVRVAHVVATAHGEAAARLTVFGTLKSYMSAACVLTIAIAIYLGSQSPGAIKTFIAHLSQAAAGTTPSVTLDRR
jgi:hypothetical protein